VIDRRALFFLSFALIAGLVITALQACNLQEFVTLDAPQAVTDSVGIPEGERVTYADADRVWRLWTEWVQLNTARLEASMSDSEERYAVLQNLASTGLGAISQEAGNLPGGGLLVGALGALGGLFLKDPRAKAREAEAYKRGAASGFEG